MLKRADKVTKRRRFIDRQISPELDFENEIRLLQNKLKGFDSNTAIFALKQAKMHLEHKEDEKISAILNKSLDGVLDNLYSKQ